jgi:hypothetical protein
MKDFIKALLDSRLQAYQGISDMPAVTHPMTHQDNKNARQSGEIDKSARQSDDTDISVNKTRKCVDRFEYETDIAVIDDNFNLIVQNVNNVVKHLQT